MRSGCSIPKGNGLIANTNNVFGLNQPTLLFFVEQPVADPGRQNHPKPMANLGQMR